MYGRVVILLAVPPQLPRRNNIVLARSQREDPLQVVFPVSGAYPVRRRDDLNILRLVYDVSLYIIKWELVDSPRGKSRLPRSDRLDSSFCGYNLRMELHEGLGSSRCGGLWGMGFCSDALRVDAM